MANQTVVNALHKLIKPEDGFIIRAAKCAGLFMEHGPSFENEESFEMRTGLRGEGEHEHTMLYVKTDATEFLDVLLTPFINGVESFGDGSTDISIAQGDDDLRYLCRIYEREKAKGDDVAYIEVTFVIDGAESEIRLEAGGVAALTVSSLNWCGDLFETK